MEETPRRIIRNTIANSISFFFIFVSNFFLIPFIVHSLGEETYGGVWAIIGSLTAYIGLLDLGTGTAFIKYISEYHTKGMIRDLLEVINTGIITYVLIGCVIIAVVFSFGNVLLTLVGVPKPVFSDAVFVLRIAACIFVLSGIASPITSIVNGIQRMDVSLYASLTSQAVMVLGTILAIRWGYGVRGLIVNNLIVATINVIFLSAAAFRLVPSLKLHARYFTVKKVKQFLHYGFNLQVSRVGQIFLFQVDRILSLRFFGAFVSTYYDLSARLTSAARSVPFVILTALIPAVSEIDAKQNHGQLIALYNRGTKYMVLLASIFFAFIIAFADTIVFAWLGKGFGPSVIFTRILAIGYFFNIVSGIASSMTAGLGKTNLDRNYGILVAVVNICLTIIGAFLLGPKGIAIGTSISLVVGALYFVHSFHKVMGIQTGEILRIFIKPMIVCATAAAVVSYGLEEFLPIVGSQKIAVAGLLASGVLYFGIVAFSSFKFRILDSYDIQIVRNIIKKITIGHQQ